MTTERITIGAVSDDVGEARDLPKPEEVVFDTLPDGLIDLPTACKKYGVNVQTANGWMRHGFIPRLGKIRAPGKGGANVTSERVFAEVAADPVKPGGRRRRK